LGKPIFNNNIFKNFINFECKVEYFIRKTGITYCLFLMSWLVCSQDTINSIQLKKNLNRFSNTAEKITQLDVILNNNPIIKDSLSANFIEEYIDLALRHERCDSALLYTNKLAEYYIFSALQHQKAYDLCSNMYLHIKACNNKNELAQFYINYAEAATYLLKYRESLSILNESISFFEKEKDSTLFQYGYTYLKAGENSTKINSISESAAYFKKASELFTFQKDTLYYLWTQNGLSTLFSKNGLYDEAEKARHPIYKLGKYIKEKQVVAMAHIRAAIDASLNNNLQQELLHTQLALDNIHSSDSDISEIVNILVLSSAVGTYARQGDAKLSNEYLKILNSKVKNIASNSFLNSYYTLALAHNANVNKNYDLAEHYVYSIMNNVKKSHEASNLLYLEYILATINENKGLSKKALFHFKKYLHIKDSIEKVASRKKFAYVQSLFESEKKDLEISRQQKNIALLSTKNKLKNQWMLFGGIGIVAVFTIIYLWRSKTFIKKKEALQKQFSQNLIKNIEQERKRISRELHDGIGQNLLLIKNKFQTISTQKEDLSLIDDTINEVRSISHSLHPFRFEKLGLIASLKHTVETLQKNSKIFYSEDIETPKTPIAKDKQIFIYRMVQECLNNVEKHSQAKACRVSLSENNTHFIFEVKDNGIGFNLSDNSERLNSLGLKTLRERAKLINAKLIIDSQKNKGTTIQIKIPK